MIRVFLRERTLSSGSTHASSLTSGTPSPWHLGIVLSVLATSQLRLRCCKPSTTSPPRRRRVCSLTSSTRSSMPRCLQVSNVGEPRLPLTALPQWRGSSTSLQTGCAVGRNQRAMGDRGVAPPLAQGLHSPAPLPTPALGLRHRLRCVCAMATHVDCTGLRRVNSAPGECWVGALCSALYCTGPPVQILCFKFRGTAIKG